MAKVKIVRCREEVLDQLKEELGEIDPHKPGDESFVLDIIHLIDDLLPIGMVDRALESYKDHVLPDTTDHTMSPSACSRCGDFDGCHLPARIKKVRKNRGLE
jgi:hypothetical protein